MEHSVSLHDHGMRFLEAVAWLNKQVDDQAKVARSDDLVLTAEETARVHRATSDIRLKIETVSGEAKSPFTQRMKTIREALDAANAAQADGFQVREEPVWGLIMMAARGSLPDPETNPMEYAGKFVMMNKKAAKDALTVRGTSMEASRYRREPEGEWRAHSENAQRSPGVSIAPV